MATATKGLIEPLERHRTALKIATEVSIVDGYLAASVGEVTAGHQRIAIFVDENLIVKPYVREAIGAVARGTVVGTFTSIHENPCEEDVLSAAAFLAPLKADCVIAIGGGSTIDTAKMGLLLAFGGGVPKDWWPEHRHEPVAGPPLYVYPTTAGTGSEVQSHALISDNITHRKMAIGHARLAPTHAILDVSLLESCPRRLMVLAGIDALSHALESAVTRTATLASTMAAIDAAAMLWPALSELSCADVITKDAARRLHAGATLAGMAIEASMLGAAHGCGNPLTARYGIVHGQAVSLMLPGVIALNERDVRSATTYRSIEQRCGLAHGSLASAVKDLVQRLGLGTTLSALGITEPSIEVLASLAMEQWTCGHNPVPMTSKLCFELYNSVL